MRTLLVIVALVAVAGAQPPSTQPYRVKKKDTLDVIAAEFYGDRAQALLIVVENRLKDRRVKAGERLRIPVTRDVTTDDGDTFAKLAQTYLGNEKRGPLLADFNERPTDDLPPTGTPITIPAQITHVAQAEETLAHVSSTYFGDGKNAELIQRYNFLDKTSLAKGESVIVPLIHIRVRPVKLPTIDSEAKSRREEHRRLQAEAEAALPLARTSWLQGDFSGVKGTLGPFADKLSYLDTALAMEIGVLLARAHVAFDENELAVKAFTQVLARKPKHMLSPYSESPKVIDAWKQAGGTLRQ